MAALLYLLVMFMLGDAIGRRYFPFVSLAHRLASAFLCGLLVSSWWTYIIAFFVSNSPSPMFWANLLFLITAGGLIYWLHRNPTPNEPNTHIDFNYAAFQRWDWILAGVFLIFVSWMMMRTFAMGDGSIMIGHHQYSDFGSTLSIMESFAVGHNFPTQFPHFSGERIRYHFLFYFQAGNLQYLGLNPAHANNILSIFSLTSLLVVIMTLGSVMFSSRIVGRIGASLYFFHGSLAFIPFLMSQASVWDLLEKLNTMTPYLTSGLPYRGEDWGVWSQNVFLNQRHLASSIGIFFLILVYLTIRYRENAEIVPEHAATVDRTAETGDLAAAPEGEFERENIEFESRNGSDATAEGKIDDVSDTVDLETPSNGEFEPDDVRSESEERSEVEADLRTGTDDEIVTSEDESEGSDFIAVAKSHSPYVVCGLLLGLLPMWNGAIFLTAAAILAMFFILLPFRKQLIAIAIPAFIISLPQIIYLRTGDLRVAGYSVFHWGFIIDNAGFFDVIYYIFFTFGFKWLLLAIALYFASRFQRKFMLAISIVFVLTFCFRFSEELLTNHKFLNVWLLLANIFVGYALVKLWDLRLGLTVVPTRVMAVVLLLLITIGGAIDLMPIRNSYFIKIKYDDDKLIEWVKANTDPKAIFLSEDFINHQILLAGRRLFYGASYYAWGLGYDATRRESEYRTMFESKDAALVYKMLKENDISYVAIDDEIRKGGTFVKSPNEEMYAKNFPLVFTDDLNQYGNMKIYQVPDNFVPPPSINEPTAEIAAANAFEAITGALPGQFSKPRGIAGDTKGNFYVADTGNSRVQKFQSDGKFVSAFGIPGAGAGEFKEPNGIVVAQSGDIYVTDSLNHRLMRFTSEGKFVKEWTGTETNFYGPRDIAIGPDKRLYIVDQGINRIIVFDSANEAFTQWGTAGSDEGQFNEATGIAIGGDLVFVTDTGNKRIQVFDLDGKFVRQWAVPVWEDHRFHYPDAVFDEQTKRLYVTSGRTNEILAFDPDGNPLDGFKPDEDQKLDNPSSLYISKTPNGRRLLVINTGSAKVSAFELETKKGK